MQISQYNLITWMIYKVGFQSQLFTRDNEGHYTIVCKKETVVSDLNVKSL